MMTFKLMGNGKGIRFLERVQAVSLEPAHVEPWKAEASGDLHCAKQLLPE